MRIECESDRIAVRITNSGEWKLREGADSGIGLANVRRRLKLCYGEEADVEVSIANGATAVGFAIPAKRQLPIPTPA
jgi:LytS/YehU family sensor histidine kinase